MEKIKKTDEEWEGELTPEQFRVTRKKETERAFSGEYVDTSDNGVYTCVCCGQELFRSSSKYDSGTGWPSFSEPAGPEKVVTKEDRSFSMLRTEVVCSRCDAHLGHVFDDGPPSAGKRYCINSAALRFVKEPPPRKAGV